MGNDFDALVSMLEGLEKSQVIKLAVKAKAQLLNVVKTISESESDRLSDADFVALMVGGLSSQQYSSRFESRFIRKNGFAKTKEAGRGDFNNGVEYFEYKFSIPQTEAYARVNIGQVRLFENLQYYIYEVFDFRESNLIRTTFKLTSEQMRYEVDGVGGAGSNNMHIDKIHTAENNSVEFKIAPFRIGSQHWNRWIENYKTDEYL